MSNPTVSEMKTLYEWARASNDPAIREPLDIFVRLLQLDLTDHVWRCRSARADLVDYAVSRLWELRAVESQRTGT